MESHRNSPLGVYWFTVVVGTLFAACGLLLVDGCGAAYYSAKTVANYQISPDGTKVISYESTKEQQGLEVDLVEDPTTGKITGLKIHVDKSGTNESAIAAALAANLKMIDMIQALLAAAATKGAGKATIP